MATLLCILLLGAEPDELQLRAACQVACDDLQVGDPLIVKLALKNCGEDVRWVLPPSFSGGHVIMVRPVGEAEFHRVLTRESNSEMAYGPLVLGRGEVLVEYDVAAASRNQFLMTSGEFELRSGTHIGEQWIYSDHVRVSVRIRSREELDRIKESREMLSWALHVSDRAPHTPFDKELLAVENSLARSSLKSMLVWRRMIREYDPEHASAPVQLRALYDARQLVDPITADCISICLALRLMHERQWELAIDVLQEVEDRSPQADGIRMECEHELKRRQKCD